MTRNFRLTALSIALASAVGSASAYEFRAGDAEVSIGGFVNAFYTYVSCHDEGSFGALTGLAGSATACGGGNTVTDPFGTPIAATGNANATVIGNGLLPNYFSIVGKTKYGNIDVGATIGIGAAVATSSGLASNNNVDVRQGFGTFGNTAMGTVKFGRDYGYFGKNAILNDMTLLGVGVPATAVQRGRVSLGHIGSGYSYLDNYGQIAYTTPGFGGFDLTAAVISPVDVEGIATADGDAPQYQALLQYSYQKLFRAWATYKEQKFNYAPAFSAVSGLNGSYRMNAYEGGAMVTVAGFGLLANYQGGKGVGILTDGDSLDDKGRNLFAQLTYNVTDTIKFGVSAGESKDKDTESRNRNATGGVYYTLAKGLTLVGEYSVTTSRSGDDLYKGRVKGAALGAILFF